MKISVILPTYNREHTLRRAIDSVLSQTLQPFEFIVIDDGSTDETKRLLKENYPMVQYLYQANGGVSSARNKGIQHSCGDWIALLDSDDEWMPDKLESQSRIINNSNNNHFIHTNEIWIRKGVRVNQMKKHEKYGGWIFEKCLDICKISPSSSMISKKIFDDIGLFDESLKVCEDYDMWLRISSKYEISYLDEPLIVKYGGHDDQLSNVKNGIEQYRIRSLEKILQSSKLNENQFNSAKKALLKKYHIYLNGAKKRYKSNSTINIENRIKYWHNVHQKY